VRLRPSQPLIGSVLAVTAAVVVTAQAMSAPPRPYKARDIIAANQPALADACVMYPAECRFNVDGSVARVVGRRIVPNSHSVVLGHFRTSIGITTEAAWDAQAPNNTND
jgi:hypothetical protein